MLTVRALLISFLPLASCGPSPAERADQPESHQNLDVARYGNRYSADLATRPEAERGLMLSTVVVSAGERCPNNAPRHLYKGHDGEKAFWVVDCGKEDYLVQIDGESSTTVLACSMMRQLAKGRRDDCWDQWKE